MQCKNPHAGVFETNGNTNITYNYSFRYRKSAYKKSRRRVVRIAHPRAVIVALAYGTGKQEGIRDHRISTSQSPPADGFFMETRSRRFMPSSAPNASNDTSCMLMGMSKENSEDADGAHGNA